MANLVYLASPYSDDDPEVMEKRYLAACDVVGKLAAINVMVYSPIVHWHVVAKRVQLPTSFSFWSEYDTQMMDVCDMVYVLAIPGWNTSVGVRREVLYAMKAGKQVVVIGPDLEVRGTEMLLVRDMLADVVHDSWSDWMSYLFNKSVKNADGTVTIPADRVERWERQVLTRYKDLTPEEQQSDLDEADRYLKVLMNDPITGPKEKTYL